MSFDALRTALAARLTVSQPARHVLIILADYAGDDGSCWPSQRTLSDRTGLGYTATRNAINELASAGLIHKGGLTGRGLRIHLNLPSADPGQPSRVPPDGTQSATTWQSECHQMAVSQTECHDVAVRVPPDGTQSATTWQSGDGDGGGEKDQSATTRQSECHDVAVRVPPRGTKPIKNLSRTKKKNAAEAPQSAAPKTPGRKSEGAELAGGHAELIHLWGQRYEEVWGDSYLFNGGRDAKAAKLLLTGSKMSPRELVAIASHAWERLPNGFLRQQSMTIHGFHSRFNELRAAVSPEKKNGKSYHFPVDGAENALSQAKANMEWFIKAAKTGDILQNENENEPTKGTE